MTTLPDGFSVKEGPRDQRTWLRDGVGALVIARPFPIPGFSQTGWEVTLISTTGAATFTIRYDELEKLAVWHCRSMASLLDTVVMSASDANEDVDRLRGSWVNA